ncbi:MAG: hypothetical protein AAFU79_01555 [Myxococcota bacterium]
MTKVELPDARDSVRSFRAAEFPAWVPGFVVAAVTLLAVALIGERLLCIRIEQGHLSVGCSTRVGAPVPEARFVDPGGATTVFGSPGWQSSGFVVEAGDRIRIEAKGRVHTALHHIVNEATAAKDIIHGRGDELSETPRFWRYYSPPEGDPTPSDVLNECKLKPAAAWGALLAIVISGDVDESSDPIRVLRDRDLGETEILACGASCALSSPRAGTVYFIVNDAVLSPLHDEEKCRGFYKNARDWASRRDRGELSHFIPTEELPLIFYHDNIGFFSVSMTTL